MTPGKPLIILDSVEKVYRVGDQEIRALAGVDLEIRQGELASIIGPSGSGKSTLMHLLGCLDTPTRGRLEVCGNDLSTASSDVLSRVRNKSIGFVFQSFNLLQKLNVRENVELPMIYAGVSARERRERAEEMIEAVGLSARANNRPSQLSGGQCQRVAIARALVNRPDVILADEPTGNLDSSTGAAILTLLKKLHEEGRTIILVTHDPKIAKETPRVITIADGKIVPNG